MALPFLKPKQLSSIVIAKSSTSGHIEQQFESDEDAKIDEAAKDFIDDVKAVDPSISKLLKLILNPLLEFAKNHSTESEGDNS